MISIDDMRRMKKHTWVQLFLITLLLIPLLPTKISLASPQQQDGSDFRRAQDMLERMTPEERVGQLFIVTFPGTRVGADTEIFDLIYNHYVGGVILLDENNNFPESEDPLHDIWSLVNQIQTNRHSTSQETRIEPDTGAAFNPAFIPLLIGLSQEGDGFPTDQIINRLTPLPSQLAIGATWNPEFSKQVGAVAGKELSALGINLLLGPSLDVNETPRTEGSGDLGIRSFGGDPFWVGEMARAYITGVHEGSQDRIAVVSKHFPGLGSSDRLPENEVATVRKSLEQLKQIELAPFFAVTGNAETPEETTDALLTSHIRYQGSANIRATTRPVSLDQTALSALMEIPELNTWRGNGGVLISDNIGSKAVRNFYDPTGEGFITRRAALDAFLAGNDLLYMGGFLSDETPDLDTEPGITGYDALIDTLDFFTQKYREDPDFAARVDDSVLRILALKYKLYGFFTLTLVLASGEYDATNTDNSQVAFSVAQKAATLINPSLEELENVLPDIPTRSDRIVIFTDSYAGQRCLECPIHNSIAVDALSNAILSLYGQEAGGVIYSGNISSHSFYELQQMLDGQAISSAVDTNLRRAQWIIFITLKVDPESPESYALRRFLSERPDLASGKRVIAFAANAPYYLDATEISKLTAYYGLFSKIPAFVDVAARLLFKEIPTPEGASPISIPGMGYDLISATSPDPTQEIQLTIDLPGLGFPDETSSTDTATFPEFRLGDTLPIRTGIILDYNSNPVPDNTPVDFIFSVNGNEAPAITSGTVNGVSTVSTIIEEAGIIEIKAVTGLAQSTLLTLNVPEERQSPTPSASVTPTETATVEPSPTIERPTPTPVVDSQSEPDITRLAEWILALAISLLVGWAALRVGSMTGQVRWGVRWGLAALIGGLLVYTYAALQFPGADWVFETPYHWGLLLITFIGALLGWGIAMIVRVLLNRK
jgi:beta-N-acetylhexosaminidase